MLCVGFGIHVFGSQHSNRREPSNWFIEYIKHGRYWWAGPSSCLLCMQQVNPPSLFTCWSWCMILLTDGHLASGVEHRSVAIMMVYMSHMPGVR